MDNTAQKRGMLETESNFSIMTMEFSFFLKKQSDMTTVLLTQKVPILVKNQLTQTLNCGEHAGKTINRKCMYCIIQSVMMMTD